MANATYVVDMPGFPEWAIPMTRIVPILSVSSAYDSFNPQSYSEIYWMWKKVDSTNFQLTVDVYASVTYENDDEDTVHVPFTLNIDLVIVNERNFFTTQTEGK